MPAHLGTDAGWCCQHEEIQLTALGMHLLFNHEEAERRDEELPGGGHEGMNRRVG